MAGATYVLDKTYKVVNANGVAKFVAVGLTNPNAAGQCDLPSGASVFSYGITQEAQTKQNENVVVRKYGISRFIAKGAINPGDPLTVATAAGDLKKADLTQSGEIFILGHAESQTTNDGDTGFVFLSPHWAGKSA